MTTFISGIPALKTIGAGRLVRALVDQGANIVWVGNKSDVADKVRNRKFFAAARAASVHYARRFRRKQLLKDPRFINSPEPVVLLHPAEIGMDWCIEFIRRRKAPTWIFMFDSSYFCIRSYNHLNGSVCLGCVGGNWQAAKLAGCESYPIKDSRALEHQQSTLELARSGKVKFLAQCETNARLARRHFGESVEVRVAGMWTDDVGEAMGDTSPHDAKPGYDVVLHGSSADAKGGKWTVELARSMPHVRFLLPFAADPALPAPLPSNIDFKPMSWASGLRAEMEKAKIALVPSLWSASIEAALVKSILLTKRAVVIDEPTAYSAEISESEVLKLPREIPKAAVALAEMIENFSPISEDKRTAWRRAFANKNGSLLANIRRITEIRSDH